MPSRSPVHGCNNVATSIESDSSAAGAGAGIDSSGSAAACVARARGGVSSPQLASAKAIDKAHANGFGFMGRARVVTRTVWSQSGQALQVIDLRTRTLAQNQAGQHYGHAENEVRHQRDAAARHRKPGKNAR